MHEGGGSRQFRDFLDDSREPVSSSKFLASCRADGTLAPNPEP